MTDEGAPEDIEFEFDVELPPLVEPGDTYIVSFVRAKKFWLWGKRLKLFMWFEIVAPAPSERPQLLFMYCNVPRDGKRWGVGFKYFRAWTLAAGRRPKRKDQLSTKIFRGKYFKARVRTVKTSAKDTKRATGCQYSIIDELLDVEAGA